MASASSDGAVPDAPRPSDISSSERSTPPGASPRHWAWAHLMRHAFDLDVLACPRCGGRLRLVATVDDPQVIRGILASLMRPAEEADRTPPHRPAVPTGDAVAFAPA